MSFLLDCPNCGRREHHEFWYGGEDRPLPKFPDAESYAEMFARVWLRENADHQHERWFHYAGCGGWITIQRDTLTNRISERDRHPHPEKSP